MTDVRPIDANALAENVRTLANLCSLGCEESEKDLPRKIYFHTKFTTAMEILLEIERNTPTLDYAPRQQWISVKDRLPEKLHENNQVYLTEEVIGTDGESAFIGQFKVYKYDGLRTFFDGNCFRSEITHWMPLPEPPKEE